MIQRIQTVYLALVFILSFVCLISTLGAYSVQHTEVADFSNFCFTTFGLYKGYESAGPWCLGVLLILVMFLTTMSIMLYRKRMRQLRLTIISTILLVGYVACYALFAWKYGLALDDYTKGLVSVDFRPSFMAMFPVLSIILNCLAIHGIRKDEALVRSLDRIR